MPQEAPITNKELKFLRALRQELKAQALKQQAAREGEAANAIFLRPDPLLYDYFTER